MKKLLLAGFALAVASMGAAQTAQQPPRAAKKPHVVPSPNGDRADEYYWLRDDSRKDPEMLAYLKAENAYADARLATLKPLQDTLYRETVSHIKQDDSSVPYRKNGYWYQTRFATGADYPVIERRSSAVTTNALVTINSYPSPAPGRSTNLLNPAGCWRPAAGFDKVKRSTQEQLRYLPNCSRSSAPRCLCSLV